MKNEKQFVIDTFKAVYGVTDLAEELFVSDENPDEVDDDKVKGLFVEYDKKKVSTTKTKSFDDGAKAREKKVKSEIESAIKTKFGINAFDSEDLEELINHAHSLTPPGKAGDLTEQQIEALPYVIGLKNKFSKQLTEKESEFNEKLTAKEKALEADKLFGKVTSIAIKKLNEKKPILPEDKKKADRRITKDLIEELNELSYLEQDGEIIPLGKDGKQLVNDNDVPVTLDDLLEGIYSENFEFEVETPPARRSAALGLDGKKKEQAPAKEVYTGKIPDNETEYVKLLNDRTLTVEQRKSIMAQYKKKKGL